MAKALVSDELWALAERILPRHEPSAKGGHPRVDDRVCLSGIIFVLRTGLPWEDFPIEMGCCGMTLHNRVCQWQAAGVFEALHHLLLSELRGAGKLDFSRVVVDSSSVRAVRGGKKPARARWTGARAAPSTISPSRPGASRWWSGSPGPTPTT
jgi:transposase